MTMLPLMDFRCVLQEIRATINIKDMYITWWKKLEVYVLPTLFTNKKWKS